MKTHMQRWQSWCAEVPLDSGGQSPEQINDRLSRHYVGKDRIRLIDAKRQHYEKPRALRGVFLLYSHTTAQNELEKGR